ncbi:MAG: histidinol-phosphate transaminase [Elusimicrobiota bacterium]
MNKFRSLFARVNDLAAYSVQEVAEGEIKLDAQENPYPIPQDIRKKIDNELTGAELNRYPDPQYVKLKELISGYCGVGPENILLGNGSDELIMSILIATAGGSGSVCAPTPTFAMYKILSQLTGREFVEIPLEYDFSLPVTKIITLDPDLVFIAYPNNPTGNCFLKEKIKRLLEHSGSIVVVDEAYFEFAGKTFIDMINRYENLIILRTFSKAFSLAGIRAGYMIGGRSLIKEMRKAQLPYNLSIINQKILETVLENRDRILESVKTLTESRDKMYAELIDIAGIKPFPSEANYILMKIDNMGRVMKALKENHIKVREFGSAVLKDYLRVTVGTEEENRSFIQTLKQALG